mmetsp:Transcript_28226/g.63930  ORF Transcript_28226/g.63930 Transcript_28226/m.63930 type:complete len:232 (-) Transcript_28226:339-1034(-)
MCRVIAPHQRQEAAKGLGQLTLGLVRRGVQRVLVLLSEEELAQRWDVGETLQRAVHEACVPQVLEADGAALQRAACGRHILRGRASHRAGRSAGRRAAGLGEPQDEVQRGQLPNVALRDSPLGGELGSGEDKALLLGGNPLLVRDLLHDLLDGVERVDFQADALARKHLHSYWYDLPLTFDKMEDCLVLHIVLRERLAILKLLASKDQALLVDRDARDILDHDLDVANCGS